MMIHRIGALMAGLSLCAQAEKPAAVVPQGHFEFFDQYCIDCHDAGLKKGKVNLEDLSFDIHTIEQAELWQKVYNAVGSGEMPPEDEVQPKNQEKADFLDDLANTMVTARKALADTGGRSTMRRLNRREYGNSIKDLLGVSIDIEALPADGGGGTFDTVGGSQFVSSDQIEQYLELGRVAIDEAFQRRSLSGKKPAVVRIEPEKTIRPEIEKRAKKIEDAQKRFSRWKVEVDKAVATPANQKRIEELKKTNKQMASPIHFYKFVELLDGVPPAKKYGFKDAFEATLQHPGWDRSNLAIRKHYMTLPHRDKGLYLKLAHGFGRLDISPKKFRPGTYRLKVRVGAVEDAPASRRFIEVGHPYSRPIAPGRMALAGAPISQHQVTGTIAKPQIIESTFELKENSPRVISVRERQPQEAKSLWDAHNRLKKQNGYGHPPAIWIDWVELEGPLEAAAAPKPVRVRVEPEKHTNVFNEKEVKKIADQQARFSRWKKEVDKAVATPANQKRIEELKKKNPQMGHPIHFYKFVELLDGVPPASKFGFKDAFEATLSHTDWDRSQLAYHKHFLSLPQRDRGTYLKLVHGTGRLDFNAEKFAPGTYIFRVRAGAVEGAPASRRFIELGHPGLKRGNPATMSFSSSPLSKHQVTGTLAHPQIIETRVEVSATGPRIFSIRERQPDDPMALWDQHNRLKKQNGYGHPPAIWIDWMEMEGPLAESSSPSWKQRREVELHANRKVGSTYRRWYQGGYERAEKFLETGEAQRDIQDEQEARFRIREYEEMGPTYRRYLEDPLTQTGAYLSVVAPYSEEFIALPPEHPSGWLKTEHVVDSLPSGNYKLRFRIGGVKGTESARHFVELGAVPEEKQFKLLKTFQVTGSTEQPQVIEATVFLTQNSPRKFALREKRNRKGDEALFREAIAKTGVGPEPALWIDWVEWEGPLADNGWGGGAGIDWWVDESVEKDEVARARKILEQFSLRAMRDSRPSDAYLSRLLEIFQTRRKIGESFDVAIRTPMSVVLASPGFLYLHEPGSEDERRELDDRELAVRLAYFLWSAPPDRELLALAKRGDLGKPAVLKQQVSRLIADPRSDAFVAGFVHQWLHMERLDFFQFDPNRHREFDESMRAASRQEVYQSFTHLLRGEGEQANLRHMLKSDYVIINGLLANYYGIEGVVGDEFRKVQLPKGSPRGGLLGMAATHAMGSDGIESSPVERGAWVLRYLLNDPPPPAPPNVPQLSRLAKEPLSTRDKVLAHQTEAQCASCHRKIDPIGFGLENFDAAGKWRTTETHGEKKQRKTFKIEPAGKFYKGPAFADYFELRDIIAGRDNDFIRGYCEALIEYGLGRPTSIVDTDLVNEMMAASKSRHNAADAFIHALVQSPAFRRK